MYSPVRHVGSIFHKGRPIHLTFFLTRRCNARCPFCFYLKSKGVPGQDRPELSLDEIEKISRSLGGLLWLAFSGGEIYLRNDLVEISKVFYRANKPAIMLFPTNGMLPEVIREKTEQIVRHCRKSTIAVKLSLDGLYDAHDALRATPGSFERTMQTYRLLTPLLGRYPNFELGINTVFCAENQDSMDEVIDFVSSLEHIRTHTISMARGNLAREHYKKVDLEKYHRAIERLECNLKGAGAKTYGFKGARLKAAQDVLQRRLIHRTLQERRRLISCYAGRLNLVLSESGEVSPCEMLDASFGNIRDYDGDMQKLIISEKAAKVIDSIRRKECYCTHECYMMTNILFNLRLYPTLMREYLQL